MVVTHEKGERYFLDAEAELELQELGQGGLYGADAVGAHGAGEEGDQHPGHGQDLQDRHLRVRVLHVGKLKKMTVNICKQ